MFHRDDPVLIGPICAGKSTIGRLLSVALGRPQRAMDDLRWDYYIELGYDVDLAERLRGESGFRALYDYWKPFEIVALERVLSEHSDCVFDLGAGHSVYEDPELFDRARRALAPFENVILLLPDPDAETCLRVLSERSDGAHDPDVIAMNEHFIQHPSNAQLATHVVYTLGKTPEQTRDEVLRRIASNRARES